MGEAAMKLAIPLSIILISFSAFAFVPEPRAEEGVAHLQTNPKHLVAASTRRVAPTRGFRRRTTKRPTISPAQMRAGRKLYSRLSGKRPPRGMRAGKAVVPQRAVSRVQRMSARQRARMRKTCRIPGRIRSPDMGHTCHVLAANSPTRGGVSGSRSIKSRSGGTKDIWDWGVFSTCMTFGCSVDPDNCAQTACACHCMAIAKKPVPECVKLCGSRTGPRMRRRR